MSGVYYCGVCAWCHMFKRKRSLNADQVRLPTSSENETFSGPRGEGVKMTKVPDEVLDTMKRQGAADTRWAAYENHALDSSLLGDIRYLAVGPSNTFKEPPKRYPDTQHGTGWAYLFVGWVNLETGEVDNA